MAHLFIVVVNDSFNRKNVNLSQIYYVLDFSFFMSQDDAYYHIHQNDPSASGWLRDAARPRRLADQAKVRHGRSINLMKPIE